jgi:hypothetical protein
MWKPEPCLKFFELSETGAVYETRTYGSVRGLSLGSLPRLTLLDLATPICICVASDRWEHHKKMKAIRRKLMARQPQSDIEFCRDISEIDRQLAVELRQRLAEAQDVPIENLYATDKLVEDLGASDSFEDLYEEALGGRNIFEVATDEVLDIVDKPDRTLQECAEEIRLLTAWTARELDRQTPDGTSESQLPT